MIDQERMEAAMDFLAMTDESYATAKADMLRCELQAKRTRARLFITGEGSVEARKAAAEASQGALEADDEYIEHIKEFETLKAKRERAEIVIDVWRTLEASRRKT